MSSTAQLAVIYERRLNLPTARAAWHAGRLRPYGVLPNTPGKPTPVDMAGAAALLIACIVGSTATDSGRLALDYVALTSDTGATLGYRLSEALDGTLAVYELRLNLDAPGAELDIVQDGATVRSEHFTDPAAPRPAYDRTATLSGALINTITDDIANAPPVRAGRRSRKDQFRA
ncbi:MAG: hypothetical protein ABIK36_06420 [Pseudomonadota bacterium]